MGRSAGGRSAQETMEMMTAPSLASAGEKTKRWGGCQAGRDAKTRAGQVAAATGGRGRAPARLPAAAFFGGASRPLTQVAAHELEGPVGGLDVDLAKAAALERKLPEEGEDGRAVGGGAQAGRRPRWRSSRPGRCQGGGIGGRAQVQEAR